MTIDLRTSFCRVCYNFCPILVEVENGRIVGIQGDRENEVWSGHTCVKGRMQHVRMRHPDRLLRSVHRQVDGTFARIAVDQAVDEIGGKLERIVGQYGPRAVAYYQGTDVTAHTAMAPLGSAFMKALGSPMVFTPNTIDKPGKEIALALHGDWLAPGQGFDDPDVALLLGNNPLITYQGAPIGNPGWLAQRLKRGMKLIVVDPRRTEVARRATVHLQARPGTDAAVLAAMLREIIKQQSYDLEFYAQNATGIDELSRAVEPFTTDTVGAWADVPPADLAVAAHMFAQARRGYAYAGTGPAMSGPSTLNEYLVLCLETLCGHWLREGEVVRDAPSLAPVPSYRAQPVGPQPARDLGVRLRVRGLTRTPAGLPTAAVADEILLEGEGQIRALISCAGNPASAWPDHEKVVRALQRLDLLVQIDPWMSQTAQLAHYVIAPKMSLEVADISQYVDVLAMHHTGYGPVDSHAQYTPAVVESPADSDLIEEWEFFYLLAQRMELRLRLEGWPVASPVTPFEFDMSRLPSKDELFAVLTMNSRVPLEEVSKHPHGKSFPDPAVRVGARDPSCVDRLDVGNAEMMAALAAIAATISSTGPEIRPVNEFRLINRRTREMYNSWVNDGTTTGGRRHNPAFMHPADMLAMGLEAGDRVKISAPRGAIAAIVDADDNLRRGLIAMTHGFGSVGRPFDLARGSNVATLVADDLDVDPYSGQPRMSNISVKVEKLVAHSPQGNREIADNR